MLHQFPSTNQIYLDPTELGDLDSFNDMDSFNRSDVNDLNGFNSQEIDGMIGMSALDYTTLSFDLPDMQWPMVEDTSPSQPFQAPSTTSNDFFTVSPDAFSDLVHSWAETDKRDRPMKQKRRDAAIDLHLQRLNQACYGSSVFDPSPNGDGVSPTTYYTPNSSLDGVPSLSRTASTGSVSPPTRSSPKPSCHPSRPPPGGVEMILDLNMNAATNVPRKQKKRTPAQIEDYRTVRRNGACAKHKQQHKKCNCYDKTASETLNTGIKKTITSKRSSCTGVQQKKPSCNHHDNAVSETVNAVVKKSSPTPTTPIPQPNPPSVQLLDPLVVPPETTPAIGEFFVPLDELFGSFRTVHFSPDAYLARPLAAPYLPETSTVIPKAQQLRHFHAGRAAAPARRVLQPSPNLHESSASASNLNRTLLNEASVGQCATVSSDSGLAMTTRLLGQNFNEASSIRQSYSASITAECNPASCPPCPMQAIPQFRHSESVADSPVGAAQAMVPPEPPEQSSQETSPALFTAMRATLAAIINIAVLAWCCFLWIATATQSFGLDCLAQIPCLVRRRRVLLGRPPVILGLS